MKNKDLEKCINELSPELQEKARQRKIKDERKKLLDESDIELSDDALEAAAGGGTISDYCEDYMGDEIYYCPECGRELVCEDWWYNYGFILFCHNPDCVACRQQWLYYINNAGEVDMLRE